MKGKSINIFERHGEKLFFLLTLVILLLVLVQQFATGGTKVKVDGQDDLTISQGYDRIATKAEGLEGQIKSNTLASDAPREAPVVIQRLYEKIPAVSDESGAIVLGVPDHGATSSGGDSGPIEGAQYAMPDPIAPSAPLVKRYSGAIDPSIVATTPGLDSIVGAQQPYDLHAVTVGATFDAAALRESLSTDPDGSGPMKSIPSHWWRGQLVLLDVELWRQEVYEGGVFGSEILVDTLPGVVSARPFLDDPNTTMPQIMKAVEGRSKSITRPDFYPVVAGQVWSPPAPPIEYSSEEQEARMHRAEIRRIAEEIAAFQKNIDDLERTDQRSRRNNNENGIKDSVARGIGGGGGRGRRGGGARTTKTAAQLASEARERQASAYEARIDELETERAEHTTWLRENGYDVNAPEVEDPGLLLVEEPVGTLKDSNTINVWASDASVEPGSTYRYRVRLVYGNPFYGRDNVLNENQRDELAGPRVIRSDYSPWSETITMDESSYYYLTRVSGGAGSFGRETSRIVYAEVYTFYYGFWRKAEVSLRPGDPIVGQFQLPELFTFEFPQADDGEVDLTQIARMPVDSTLTRSMESIVLDVRPSARVSRDGLKGGRDNPDFEAVLLEGGSEIAIRDPAKDRVSERRRQMRKSADEGVSATVVEPGVGGVAGAELDEDEDRNERPGRNTGREDRERRTGGLGR